MGMYVHTEIYIPLQLLEESISQINEFEESSADSNDAEKENMKKYVRQVIIK